MLKIRLRRPGKSVKGRYHYKIVVIESKAARESKFTDELLIYSESIESARQTFNALQYVISNTSYVSINNISFFI